MASRSLRLFGNSKLPVAIIGNGVGAFTSALSLHRLGIRNNIFTAHSKLGQTARHGVFLGGSAIRILDRLGLGSDYRAFGSPIHHIQINDKHDNKLMNFNLDGRGHEVWIVPKDYLLQLFYESIPCDSVHFNYKLRSLKKKQRSVQMNFSQRLNVDTDFVIGADGNTSTVRMFMSRSIMTMNSGVIIWKCIVRHLNLNEIPFHILHEIWHEHLRFGFVRIQHDQVMWWAINNNTSNININSHVNSNNNNNPILLRPFAPHLTRIFHDFPQIVHKLLSSIESDRHIERQHVKRVWPNHSPWIDRSSWRLSLVGDARRSGIAEMFHLNHSFAVDDAYILANVLVDQNHHHANYNYDVDDHPLVKYEENREDNLQLTRDLSRHAYSLANARSFPQRYIGKTLLNQAINRMTDQGMSSILPNTSMLNS